MSEALGNDESVQGTAHWLMNGQHASAATPDTRRIDMACRFAFHFQKLGQSRGYAIRSEATRIVYQWVEQEIFAAVPPDWKPGFETAIKLGLDIYRTFNHEFNRLYMDTDGQGVRLVRRALRRHLGYVVPPLEEGVLDRIRDRRLHLLHGLRNKYQPSLFGERSFNAERVPGYLVRVAEVETRRAADEYRPSGISTLTDLANLPAPGDNDESGDANRRMVAHTQRLVMFWGSENGFTKQQFYEAMTSLCLGSYTGNAELGRRCQEFLQERLPSWEAKLAEIRRRSGRYLFRVADLRSQLANSGSERTQMEMHLRKLEDARSNLERRLARHLAGLRPCPADVARLLEGIVTGNLGNIRFRRIAHEVCLFEQRVRVGFDSLQALREVLPASALSLMADVHAHLAARPESQRAQGLSSALRTTRRSQTASWLTSAEELRHRFVYELRTRHDGHAGSVSVPHALKDWLEDATDLYELGLLTRKGVIEGLARRQGRRLERLLRLGF